MGHIQRGLLLAFASCAGNACFLVTYKLAAGLGDASDATLIMLASAAALNTVTSVVQEGGRLTVPRDRLSWLLALGLALMTLLGNELAIEAVRLISAPLTSVLQQTQVLVVALLGRVVLSETVRPPFWLGTAIAASGLYVIHGGAPSSAAHVDRIGMLFAAGSAACFAIMSVYTRKFVRNIRPVNVNALRLWMSLTLWFAVHLRLPHGSVHPMFIVYCVLAGAFGPYLSRTALMYALANVSPTQTALMGLLTPVITIIPAFCVFGTIPSMRELVGSAIMTAGVALPILAQLFGPAITAARDTTESPNRHRR